MPCECVVPQQLALPQVTRAAVPAPPPQQCPTCGTQAQDWRDAATRITGADGYKIRLNTDDRLEAYRRWRYDLKLMYATDIDQIEWRYGRPVAILEMTMVGGALDPPPKYLAAILDRRMRDHETQRLDHVAAALNVRAYVVCYREDLCDLWIHQARPLREGWRHLTQADYVAWLRSL